MKFRIGTLALALTLVIFTLPWRDYAPALGLRLEPWWNSLAAAVAPGVAPVWPSLVPSVWLRALTQTVARLTGARVGSRATKGNREGFQPSTRSGSRLAPGASSSALGPYGTPETEAEAEAVAQVVALAQMEGARLGFLDRDPRTTERRLRSSALSLSREQSTALVALAANPAESADARFAALQLAAWSGWGGDLLAKASALGEFATRPQDPRLTFEQGTFASVLRGVAAEALLDLPGSTARERLEQVAMRSSDPFAVDRAQRALWHLVAEAPGPEAQDRLALSRLVGARP